MAARPAEAAPTPASGDAVEAVPTPEHGAEFDDAFAAAAADFAGGETPPATPPAEEPPAPAAETPPAPAAEEPPAAPPAETPPAETPPQAETPPAPASAEDIVKGLADLLKQQPLAGETPPAPAAEPQQEEPLYQPAELEVMEEYQKNWPDVFKAEQLVRRAEYHDLMKFMFGEVAKYVAPIFDQVRTIGYKLLLAEVKSLVPEYSEELEQKVAAWVETQPAYLQGGMKQVMQFGTSDDIADLIRRYEEATGAAPPPATPPVTTPPAAAPAQTELSKAAKQAVASLAPVSSERSQVPAGEDPGDYDSAFARYAREAMNPK